jgi:hypothetical protein
MEFETNVKQFGNRVNSLKNQITNEESTKTSLVMPFFSMLGYDIFNPQEFVPEFTADFGTKKGEKVDYAIMSNGAPLILVEAKACNNNCIDKYGSQLFRYFTTTKARLAILTNGIKYLFFTDLDEQNKLDEKPFLVIDFEDLIDHKIKELNRFRKESFDINDILTSASELKYLNQFNMILTDIFDGRSQSFNDFLLSEIYPGRKTQLVKEKFEPIITKAIKRFKTELLSDFLNQAISKSTSEEFPSSMETPRISEPEDSTENNAIITTLEEIECYGIVKTLLSESINLSRITYRDTLSYFAILLDNNTWKWICRIYLRENRKYIIIPDMNKQKNRYDIENIQDIIKFKKELVEAVEAFL